jgi:hypothetical protein
MVLDDPLRQPHEGYSLSPAPSALERESSQLVPTFGNGAEIYPGGAMKERVEEAMA